MMTSATKKRCFKAVFTKKYLKHSACQIWCPMNFCLKVKSGAVLFFSSRVKCVGQIARVK